MGPDPFINYTHPDQQRDKTYKRKIVRYIGVHSRNRSRPASRNEPGYRSTTAFVSRGLVPEGRQRALTFVWRQDRRTVSIPRDKAGLRQDPFGAYPMTQSYTVDIAIDHFINAWAPSHLLRPEVVEPEANDVTVQTYFQYALQNQVMFQATVALALADSSVSRWPQGRISHAVLLYYGQSISTLRHSLLDSQMLNSDALLFAIMALMGVDYLVNDMDAFAAHLSGLRQVVYLRGGLDAIGYSALLKPSVLSIEAFWTYLCSQSHVANSPGVKPSPVDMPETALIFDELDLDDLLQSIPSGYSVLDSRSASARKLLNIIYCVAQRDVAFRHDRPTPVDHWDGARKFLNFSTEGGHPVTAASVLQLCGDMAKVLASPDLFELERTCSIAMFIYLLGFSKSEQLSPIYFAQLQRHTQELLDVPLTDETPAESDLTAWAMFVVSSTLLPLKEPKSSDNGRVDKRFDLAVKLVRHFSQRRSWTEMQAVLKKFIWNDSCITSWRTLWHFVVDHLQMQACALSSKKPAISAAEQR